MAETPNNEGDTAATSAGTTATDATTTEVMQPPQMPMYGMMGSSAGSLYGGGYGGGLYGQPGFPVSSPGFSFGGAGAYGLGGGFPMGPLANLNAALFGVQNVVFSLGQAIQIIGMNTDAIQQLFHSARGMLENALRMVHQLRVVEAKKKRRQRRRGLGKTLAGEVSTQEDDQDDDDDEQKRQRLRAIRWGLVLTVSYSLYRLFQHLLLQQRRRQRRRLALDRDYSQRYAWGGRNTPEMTPPEPQHWRRQDHEYGRYY